MTRWPWRISIACGVIVGAIVLLIRHNMGVAILFGLSVGGIAWLVLGRRERRRAQISKGPFPSRWREVLSKEVTFYERLDEKEKRRFEIEIAIFISEQTITGPRMKAIDDELKVLVAASAIAIVFGRPGFRYPTLRDIVVYDRSFDEDYAQGGNILGMVHAQGPILFSAASLRRGFQTESDGQNVGYHEFAHVLDFEGGSADGVPGGFMAWSTVRPWLALMHAETAKVKRRKSVLRQYAATNEAEFFAVATEMFFEQPAKMKGKHPELYALLRDTYGQDPAAANSGRLVTEQKSI